MTSVVKGTVMARAPLRPGSRYEFGEVVDDDVSAVVQQGTVSRTPVDADGCSEASRRTGGYPGQGVLDDDRSSRIDTEFAGSGEVGVRLRFAGEVLSGGHVAVDDDVEAVEQPGCLQDGAGVAGRGDHRRGDAQVGQHVEQGDRARKGLHPVRTQNLDEVLVLAVAQPGDTVLVGRGVWGALWQCDVAGGEEVTYPGHAGFAVDVIEVVLPGEGLLAMSGEELVEHLGPGTHVDPGGRGDHAVEIEQGGPVAARFHGYLRSEEH